jgi:hypothetical protein
MRTTFDDPHDHEAEEPEEPSAWVAAGFAPEEAATWRQWRFRIALAKAWRTAGVTDGLAAAQWSTAGVSPSTLPGWRAAGIEASEAVHWHELGFGLAEARTHKKGGLGPEQAMQGARTARRTSSMRGFGRGRVRPPPAMFQRFHESIADPRMLNGYLQHQWMDDDALAWARNGVTADDAYLWHDLGLRPVEAGRLASKGLTPGEVIREWWRSGIPFDEVADWIGAGLTAAEAAEQRAKGITVEHAAALRALRQHEAPPAPDRRPGLRPMWRQGPPESEPPGPPPENVDEAHDHVCHAFAHMLTPDGTLTTVPSVDGGDNLGPCLSEAAQRVLGRGPIQATVTTEDVQFVNDHTARVRYSVVVSGGENLHLGDRVGRAVLVRGVWKVSRETFCQFMQMAGVECPPPKSDVDEE